MDFHTYIHAVGTGHKGNRDLTHDESADMMTQMLEQSVYPEQISALLLGWRIKPETTEEFRGALHACDAYTVKTPVADSIELGYPFDGKTRNPYIFPLVADALVKEGVNLVVYGDVLQPAKGGITVQDVCRRIESGANLHYFDRADYCPKLHELTELRSRLGLRTAINTIEKLPGVSGSDCAMTGVFHKPFVQKYIDMFGDRYRRFALLQGNEGTPELFSKGRVWISEDGKTEEHIIEPERYGVDYQKSWEHISLEESLEQILNPSSAFKDLARLNAAVILFVMGRAGSIDEAYERLHG